MRIAVAGATGVVGTHVVAVAGERGHEVVELARSRGVDLTTGDTTDDGLEERLVGVDAVIDAVSTPSQRRTVAERFFGAVTRHLLDAERAAGVGHHVVLSIVGIDGATSGYYRGKQLQERLVEQQHPSEDVPVVPWSTLRATQFHEFAQQALRFVAVGRTSLVPTMLSQPVAAREVAEVLVDLVEAGPSGRVADLAGPERLWVPEMARRVVRARGLDRRVVPLHVPGPMGRHMRSGALCPDTDGPRGRTTFADWLRD